MVTFIPFKKNCVKNIFTLCCLICLLGFLFPERLTAQFYQGTNMEFGKNRIQYKDFVWFYYPSQNFEVYYYIGGEDLAQYTLLSAEQNLPQIEKFYDHDLSDKVQIVTYLKQTEFRQSNVGLGAGEQFNIGGSASIIGNKMFAFYEGSHAAMENQLRKNISRVVYSEMMYGGDWKDVLKSSTLLSLPVWFEEGVIAYAAEGAPESCQNYMKDIAASNQFKSFNYLEGKEAVMTGQAFWNYISEVYGESVIANILYMTQASRSAESGFLYILGLPIETITSDFLQFYRQKAASPNINRIPSDPILAENFDKSAYKKWKKDQKKMGDLNVKYKKKYNYTQIKASPDGQKIAYVTNERGQYRIWLYDVETKKKKSILKKEYKLDRPADESFPVLAWHPTSEVLTYIYEKHDVVYIGNYTLSEKKSAEKKMLRIEKVIDLQYSPDGKKMIFSGVNRGKTDLYLYQVIGNNFEQLTRDIWDDMNPNFIDGGRKIIFASNRPDDTLRSKVDNDVYVTDKDIFIYDLETRNNVLERITNTPSIDERYPAEYKDKHYTYLSNINGHYNRYLATVDSAIAAIDTSIHYRYFTVSSPISNYPRSPKNYQYYSRSQNYNLVFEKAGKPIVHLNNNSADNKVSMPATGGVSKTQEGKMLSSDFKISSDTIPVGNIDIRQYEFEDERKNYTIEKQTIRVAETITPAGNGTKTDSTRTKPELPRSRNYRLNFAADKIVTQLNNTFFAPVYQNFTGPSSSVPGLSGLTQIGITDLFEDYKVVGGFRFSLDLTNQEYGLSVENLKGRWDKKLQFVRQVQRELNGFDVFKIQMNNFSYTLKYPFTELSSFRIRTDVRYDRIIHQSNDIISLSDPNSDEFNVALKLEYVFDNVSNKGLNLYNGTRFKIWAERFQQPNTNFTRTDLNVVGFDFRHYEKIHRSLIAAFRVGAASSFGTNKIMHYMGGVDNWLAQRVDNSTPIDYQNTAYRFQSFIGPVRGFYVNARNGNSAAVANAELRWPVFKYFMRKQIKSDFIENFQIISFLDAGTAWSGKDPYSDENLFNRTTVSQQPVSVTVMNNREPIVYGYGFGLRSRILGYFVRADWAWGVDDGMVLDRVFYLSLNLDF